MTSNRYDSLKKLLLTFNNHIFYILTDVIAHIYNYPEEQAQIALYINVVKQASTMFTIELAFTKSLIKTIKKKGLKVWIDHMEQ